MIALLGAMAAVLATILALKIIDRLMVAGVTRAQATTAVAGYTIGVAATAYGLVSLLW